jgi:hypothetical protein
MMMMMMMIRRRYNVNSTHAMAHGHALVFEKPQLHGNHL